MKTMWDIPAEPKAIRARIRRYERALEKEKRGLGGYHDGAGKRFFLGPLYMAMGDDEGAERSFEWFAREFPDSSDDPMQGLCWALLLHRRGHEEEAKLKLCRTMIENRYVVRRLLGESLEGLGEEDDGEEFEHEYAMAIPQEFLELWNEEERGWCREQYEGAEFAAVRGRFLKLDRLLHREPVGAHRSSLVKKLSALRREPFSPARARAIDPLPDAPPVRRRHADWYG